MGSLSWYSKFDVDDDDNAFFFFSQNTAPVSVNLFTFAHVKRWCTISIVYTNFYEAVTCSMLQWVRLIRSYFMSMHKRKINEKKIPN